MVNARVTVTGPSRAPHRFGLFSAVPVLDITDEHAYNGVQWEPGTCERPQVLPDGSCCGTAKEFTPPGVVGDATAFTVAGTWQCALLGYTPAQAQQRAREHLALGEQQAVEWAVWTGQVDEPADTTPGSHGPYFAHESTIDLGEVHCATDLIAVIEAATAGVYTGVPVLHVPRPVLPYLLHDSQVQVVSGARIETVGGIPVAVGAGYAEANLGPGGVPAPPGSWWVYVTGAMVVWRGPVITPPTPEVGFSRCNNEMSAIAERVYLAGWDCFTAGVLFTPCCPCGAPTPPPPPGGNP